MIRASIDLGTNTCLLLIAEWDPLRSQVGLVLHDEAQVVRLGEGVDEHEALQLEPMRRTQNCLKSFQNVLLRFNIEPSVTVCVATSQARDAQNSAQFFKEIEKDLGFHFRILSGEEEARYTFLGALLPGMNPSTSLVLDIGGGSTELVRLNSEISIDCGSVRLTERMLVSDPVTTEEIEKGRNEILQVFGRALENHLDILKGDLVGVAGTITTLAAWSLKSVTFDRAKIDQAVLTKKQLEQQVKELSQLTVAERKLLPGVHPERADVLLAGALILQVVMERGNFKQCCVSTRGLRYGVLCLADKDEELFTAMSTNVNPK